jgi:hypothetical protein
MTTTSVDCVVALVPDAGPSVPFFVTALVVPVLVPERGPFVPDEPVVVAFVNWIAPVVFLLIEALVAVGAHIIPVSTRVQTSKPATLCDRGIRNFRYKSIFSLNNLFNTYVSF